MDRLAVTLTVLDYAAVAVFGATGALAAARRKHDIVTFGFFAAVTGVGGGTLRDLLIGAPVFWVGRPGYVVACLAAAAAVWMLGPRRFRGSILTWLDAVGMAAYAVVGALKATSLGIPPFSAVVMGVLTACAGGIIRDVLAGEPSILMRPEIYVTAAALSSALFVALTVAGLPALPAAAIAFVAAFLLRGMAIAKGLKLPGYAAR